MAVLMKKEFFPGWILMIAVAAVSIVLSNQITAGGKHPLEATALAVVLGILGPQPGARPEAVFHAGIKTFEKFLIWGVILIGATLNFKDFGSQGPKMLTIILVTMLVSYFVIYALGRLFKLPWTLSTLLSVGTTICGGSAIAVTAPLIKAKEEETSYAIGTITLWGLAAILLYPEDRPAPRRDRHPVRRLRRHGHPCHAPGRRRGIHLLRPGRQDRHGRQARPQLLHGPAGLRDRGLVREKSLGAAEAGQDRGPKFNAAKAFPWFLFGYFIMAGLNTAGYFSKTGIDGLTWLGRFLITISMAGIGLNTVLGAFKKVGLKPLVVGLLGALVVAGVSIAMIALIL